MTQNRAAVIFGAGPGLGAAFSRGFAEDGFHVCPVRRNGDALNAVVSEVEAAGGTARAFSADGADEAAVETVFDTVEREIGPVELAIFNAGGFVTAPVCETSVETFRKTWENAALAGFLTGRAAARRMAPRGRGTILFTGATASTRGGSGFTAFSGAKFALKAVAQAMARELGPKGVHVAHIILDGVVSTPSTREWLEDADRKAAESTVLDVEAVTQAYRNIVRQPRSAWTFETDLRPWSEDW